MLKSNYFYIDNTIKNNKKNIEHMANTTQDYFNLEGDLAIKGNFKLEGTITASDFLSTDGKPIGLPKEISIKDNKVVISVPLGVSKLDVDTDIISKGQISGVSGSFSSFISDSIDTTRITNTKSNVIKLITKDNKSGIEFNGDTSSINLTGGIVGSNGTFSGNLTAGMIVSGKIVGDNDISVFSAGGKGITIEKTSGNVVTGANLTTVGNLNIGGNSEFNDVKIKGTLKDKNNTVLRNSGIAGFMFDGANFTAALVFPVFYSLNSINRRDDSWIVNPGYKLELFQDENFSGMKMTLDNTNGTIQKRFVLASADSNKTKSFKVYYDNILIDQPSDSADNKWIGTTVTAPAPRPA